MAGGGFMHTMIKTLEQNKKLLSRASVFDKSYNRRYEREKSASEHLESKPVDKKVLIQIKQKLQRQRKRQIIKGFSIFLAVSVVIGGAVFYVMTAYMENYPWRVYKKMQAESFVIMGTGEDGLDVRIEYFPYGSKWSETKYKNGMRHQQSESYYQTGEQFRSAAYFYDTLITEVYFYKNGDTIKSFPTLTQNEVHHLKLEDSDGQKRIELDVFDGKIAPDSYQEFVIGDDILSGEECNN